jgi:hypothetical protein
MRPYRTFEKFAVAIFLITIAGQVVIAQAPKRARWEYCSITEIKTPFVNTSQAEVKPTAIASICYFRAAGCVRVEVKYEAGLAELTKDLSPQDRYGGPGMYVAREKVAQGALARAIAKLGADGWEMVGQAVFVFDGSLNNPAIYFKRRK